MKITNIRTLRLRGPRPHSVGGKEGEVTRLILRVDTDAGIYGLGESQDFMGVLEAVDYIRACLTGRSPFDVRPAVSDMLYGTLPPHHSNAQYDGRKFDSFYQPIASYAPTATPAGPILWAISAVEMALCDLVGKALQTPCYNLFGGKCRDKVGIYLDRSSPLASDDLDAWRGMAADTMAAGFSHMKFDIEHTAPDYTRDVWNRSINGPQLRRIAERLRAVRETAGWDAEICVDGHMCFNAVDAVRLAHELADLKLMWLEDPVPITNPDALASVRAQSSIPICTGEMFNAEQFRLFIDRRSCDIIHPDVLFCGGLHETRRIADYAELHYMPMAMHGNGGALATIAAAHVAAGVRNFLGLEYHFYEAAWIGEFVSREGTPLFDNGKITLTDAPGLGVELNRQVCLQHLDAGQSMWD
ncbi:MAG: mandelate racemase/muconate lactonizing enzyme family protein [Bryobacteraceae bacterium]